MNKWLIAAAVLLTACILQVCSYKSTEVEDALLQQSGSHLEAKVADHLPSNMTAVDKYDSAHEYVLLPSSGEDALAQLDQLSLVTRYTGAGYNIIRGNPEGDFNRGGIDPGIRITHVIFTHTYKIGKRAFYRGRAMEVPDQVSFHMSQSCASSHSVKAYSGRKSYMKELETSVSVGGKKLISKYMAYSRQIIDFYTGSFSAFVSVSFSLSHGMS